MRAVDTLVLFAVLVGGCTMGEDYRRPQTGVESAVPAGWWATAEPAANTAARIALVADEQALAAWWEWFEDPVLNTLIERAFAQNLDVRAALARIAAARAERRAASAGRGPTLDVGTSASRYGNPLPGLVDGLTFSFYEAGFDADWELDLFGRLQRRVEAAEAALEAALEDRRWVQTVLCTEVTRAYWDMRHSERRIATAERAVALAERTAALSARLVAAGITPGQAGLRADADVAARAAELPALRIALTTAQRQVELLLGEPPAALATLLTPRETAPPRMTPRALLSPAAVLRNRPDIQQAERQLAAATALKAAAIADMYPHISLGLFFGARNTAIGMLLNAVSKSWSAAGAVAVPLFDAGRLRAAVDVSDARVAAALVNYERAMLGALHETELALLRLLERERERQARTIALADLRAATRLATQRAAQGVASQFEVVRAERAANAAALALQTTDSAITTETIAVMKALGAGVPRAPEDLTGHVALRAP